MNRYLLLLALALIVLQQAAGQALTLTDTRFYGNNGTRQIVNGVSSILAYLLV